MILKPQDVLILLKVSILDADRTSWSYATLSRTLLLSSSEAHAAVRRAQIARLMTSDNKPRRAALLEFLVHGVKYAYPAQRGGETRGMPTASSAPPLSGLITASANPPVWPWPEGTVRGYEFAPIYESVPRASLIDEKLYELLALTDAIRDGGARETGLATGELRKRLCG